MRTALLVVIALVAAPALAQGAADAGTPSQGPAAAPCPDGGPCASPDDAALQRELEKQLQADTKQPRSAPPAATSAPAPTGAGVPQTQGGRSAFQSLNPDISAIVDANAGYERRAVSYRNGDDPDLRSAPGAAGAGFAVQEIELALSAVVDPYFKGEVYLTIPNLSGLEVEEAVVTTTSLPANLQARAGSFRSAFGRQNGQHLHVQDFTRRPLVNGAFLGADGLRGPGAQVSWLAPLPFFLTLYAEAFSLSAPDAPASPTAPVGPVASFGGGSATDLTYVGAAKVFVPLGDEWSIYGGLDAATGVSPGFLRADARGAFPGAGRRSEVFGADLYVKWKPPNVAGGYRSLTWQTEALFRHFESAGGLDAEWDGGLYSQLVVQLARRWFLGVRGDVLGLPTSSVLASTLRGSASVTFQASEFARVRAYGELERASPTTAAFVPTVHAAADPATSFAAYLQLEISIGAHGAHAF